MGVKGLRIMLQGWTPWPSPRKGNVFELKKTSGTENGSKTREQVEKKTGPMVASITHKDPLLVRGSHRMGNGKQNGMDQPKPNHKAILSSHNHFLDTARTACPTARDSSAASVGATERAGRREGMLTLSLPARLPLLRLVGGGQADSLLPTAYNPPPPTGPNQARNLQSGGHGDQPPPNSQ